MKKLLLLSLLFSSTVVSTCNSSSGTLGLSGQVTNADNKIDKNADYDYELNLADYIVNRNINDIAEHYQDETLWFYKAITNQNDRFYESIKNLKILIARACVDDEEQFQTFIDQQMSAIITELEKIKNNYHNIATFAKTEHGSKILGLLNAINIAEKIRNRYNELKNEEQPQEMIQHVDSIQINAEQNEQDSLIKVVSKTDKNLTIFTEKLLVYFNNSFDNLFEYLQHDVKCYLYQFGVINDCAENGLKSYFHIRNDVNMHKNSIIERYNSLNNKSLSFDSIYKSITTEKEFQENLKIAQNTQQKVLELLNYAQDPKYNMKCSPYETKYLRFINKYLDIRFFQKNATIKNEKSIFSEMCNEFLNLCKAIKNAKYIPITINRLSLVSMRALTYWIYGLLYLFCDELNPDHKAENHLPHITISKTDTVKNSQNPITDVAKLVKYVVLNSYSFQNNCDPLECTFIYHFIDMATILYNEGLYNDYCNEYKEFLVNIQPKLRRAYNLGSFYYNFVSFDFLIFFIYIFAKKIKCNLNDLCTNLNDLCTNGFDFTEQPNKYVQAVRDFIENELVKGVISYNPETCNLYDLSELTNKCADEWLSKNKVACQ